MNFLRHRIATRRFFGVALLALLLGQWTVLTHSIAHALAPATIALATETDHHWGHRAGTPACDLVDHLLTGQAPGVAAALADHLPSAATRVATLPPSIASGPEARAYEARGPPRA